MRSVAELKDSFTLMVKFSLELVTKSQMENGGINPPFLSISISPLHGSGWSTLCFGRFTSLKGTQYPFYSFTVAERVINVVTHVRGLLIQFVHRSAGCLNVNAAVQRRSLSLSLSLSMSLSVSLCLFLSLSKQAPRTQALSSVCWIGGSGRSLHFLLQIVVSVAVPRSSFEEDWRSLTSVSSLGKKWSNVLSAWVQYVCDFIVSIFIVVGYEVWESYVPHNNVIEEACVRG